MPDKEPLDLRAVEAYLRPHERQRILAGWELAELNYVAALLVYCRALRAALEDFFRDSPYKSEESRVEYWSDVRERAAAVLAQATDEE